MVSMIDILEQGISSSVYTFYDSLDSTASFGSYSILWQIEQGRLSNFRISIWATTLKRVKKYRTR